MKNSVKVSPDEIKIGTGFDENGVLVCRQVIESDTKTEQVSVSDKIKNHKQKSADLKLRIEGH